MEIDETFSSLEEIQSLLEKDGMTWRISADDDGADEEDNGRSKIVLESVSFSADADADEIEKWEAELPDEKEEDDEEPLEENISADETQKEALERAEVVYFDIFKKKTYVKTLIFCRENETKTGVYRLIGFCEAPMF